MVDGLYNPRKDPVWQSGEEGDDMIVPTTVAPVAFDEVKIATGERLGDFTRRMYGSNTNIGRQRILAANGGQFPSKGVVNVPR